MKKSNNGNGLTAIYVRRSVSDSYKGNNSLSINAQKEECIRFVGDEPYRIYCDMYPPKMIQFNLSPPGGEGVEKISPPDKI